MLVIILLLLVIALLVKVTRLENILLNPNAQWKRPDVTPEMLEELKYLKSAGLTVTAESRLKSIGFTASEARAFISAL